MKANAETSSKSMDALKWIVVFALVAAAIIGNNFYGELPVVMRSTGVVVLVAIACGIAAITTKGRAAITFAGESRMEVRKIIWPTRQETLQTTLIVLAVTVAMSIILWGIDSGMVRLVRIFTGV